MLYGVSRYQESLFTCLCFLGLLRGPIVTTSLGVQVVYSDGKVLIIAVLLKRTGERRTVRGESSLPLLTLVGFSYILQVFPSLNDTNKHIF